jgi:glycerate kinase
MSDDPQAALIAGQLRHMVELLKRDNAALSKELEHQKELSRFRLEALERQAADFETRIRAATEGVTMFKVVAGLGGIGGLGGGALALFRSLGGG